MPLLTQRLSDLRASPVRAMLEASQKPDVISFAGGLPAPETFAKATLPASAEAALQYGPSEGEPRLRALIAEELQAIGLDCDADQVLILSGSQQGIDLSAKLTVDAGTRIAVESPTYLAALQVFRFFGAAFESMPPDLSVNWTRQDHPAMAYIIPTFQNPTGRCWSADEREAFAHNCEASDVILFEDDPYRDLAYEACERRPVASWMKQGSWIYQGSFSKTLSPGLRLGFMVASRDLYPHLLLLKQAADLHSNRLSQYMVIDQLTAPDRAARRDFLVSTYRARRDAFADAMRRHLGNAVEWQVPPGGLFFWLTLPDHVDVDALLAAAIKRKVLFTPGRPFYADEALASPSIRLNFSHASQEAADAGLAILGDLLRA
nr:PLP-dependent aminotransferase family protein [Henriciella aquimarina]